MVLIGLPGSLDDGRAETSMLGVTLLQDWTVQSALNLELPDRPLTVRVESTAALRGPAETLKFACSPRQDVVEFATTY